MDRDSINKKVCIGMANLASSLSHIIIITKEPAFINSNCLLSRWYFLSSSSLVSSTLSGLAVSLISVHGCIFYQEILIRPRSQLTTDGTLPFSRDPENMQNITQNSLFCQEICFTPPPPPTLRSLLGGLLTSLGEGKAMPEPQTVLTDWLTDWLTT